MIRVTRALKILSINQARWKIETSQNRCQIQTHLDSKCTFLSQIYLDLKSPDSMPAAAHLAKSIPAQMGNVSKITVTKTD